MGAGHIERGLADRSGWLPGIEFWLLALSAAAICFPRLAAMPMRGEETRWAEVAREMRATGDWIVPRQQGQPVLSRPPLGSYAIAAASRALGDSSLSAVRLPSAIATWLTALLIYGYGRRFLSRLGALAAALAFLTMGQVLPLSRLGESEALFTLLVSGSLLVWHWGYSRGWPALAVWMPPYALAALAMLTKGVQGPAYFVTPVCGYLILRRDWRMLCSGAHLAGLAVFAVLLGAWLVPFWQVLGPEAVKQIWTSDVAMHWEDAGWGRFFAHLALYPLEILICTLPWSPLLLAYLRRDFRRAIGAAVGAVAFLSVALAVTFPTCWLVPGGKSRYFMPLYPCLAILMGLVVERVFSPAASPALERAWRVMVRCSLAAALFAGVTIAAPLVISSYRVPELTQPVWFALVYFVAALGGFAVLWRLQSDASPGAGRTALLTMTALVGLSFVGVAINGMVASDDDPAPAVAALKQKLPRGVRLVSFGLTETLFDFYYAEPIEPRPWPKAAGDLEPGRDYFCFTWDRPAPPDLPFPWQIVAMISADRKHHDWPHKEVIIARRLSDAVAVERASPSED